MGTGECKRSKGKWNGGHLGIYSAVPGPGMDRQCPLVFQSGTVAGVMCGDSRVGWHRWGGDQWENLERGTASCKII